MINLWTLEDDSLFLKYCPNARDRCYHAMSRDSAARPNELLKLKIKDVVFKLTPDKKQYAEILINEKTGTRHIPLIDSIPYIKDWISQHPQGGNPNIILLCGFGRNLNRIIHDFFFFFFLFKKILPQIIRQSKCVARREAKDPENCSKSLGIHTSEDIRH